MYIKIKHGNKDALHEAKHKYVNYLKDGLDLNIESYDGTEIKYHFPDITKVDIYVMNDDGKTIDHI
jgi:hypothetical protein